MHSDVKWKFFFRFAAIFNFSAALGLLLIPELFFQLLGMSSIFKPEIIPWVHQFGVLVLTFGIGYWVISLDPEKHRDIIWMGCVGKVLVFAAAWFDLLSTPALLPFAILVVADLLFAIFYGRYLLKSGSNYAEQPDILS